MDGGLRDRQLGLGLASWSLALHGLQVRQWLGGGLARWKQGRLLILLSAFASVRPVDPCGHPEARQVPYVQGW